MLDQIVLPNVTVLLGGASVQSLIDQLMPQVRATLDRMQNEIDTLTDQLNMAKATIHADLEMVEAGLGNVERETKNLCKVVGGLESQIDGIETNVEDLEGRIDTLESDALDVEKRLDDSDATLEGCHADSIADDIKADVSAQIETIQGSVNNLHAMIMERDEALNDALNFQHRIKMAVNAV